MLSVAVAYMQHRAVFCKYKQWKRERKRGGVRDLMFSYDVIQKRSVTETQVVSVGTILLLWRLEIQP